MKNLGLKRTEGAQVLHSLGILRLRMRDNQQDEHEQGLEGKNVD